MTKALVSFVRVAIARMKPTEYRDRKSSVEALVVPDAVFVLMDPFLHCKEAFDGLVDI